MTAQARPARFDQSQQGRRAALAKVHVARKELAMVEDDYRQLLMRTTGQMSAGDCSMAQLDKVLAEMKRMGFVAKQRAKGADHPAALKARALWISLGHLGVVRNPSEEALEAFAAKQLKIARLQWADQARVYKLIEALKAMGERAGWSQSTEAVHLGAVPRVLQERLCNTILAKLVQAGLADADWPLPTAAFRLAGVELPRFVALASAEDLGRTAKALGERLRGERERAR